MKLLGIKKFLKIYYLGNKYGIEADMEYKTDFYFMLIRLIFTTLMVFGMVELFFINTEELNGWTKQDFYLITAVFMLTKSVFELLLIGITEIPGDIKNGYFDRSLLKPINLFSEYTSRGRSAYVLPNVFAYMCILIYALKLGGRLNIALLIYSIIITCIFYFAVLLFIISLNFFANFQANFTDLFREIMEFGRIPPSFYGKNIQIFFTFIFPVFSSAGIVFLVQKGEIPAYLLINIGIVILAFLYFSLKFWHYSIRRYTSASN
ncbi:ABC-2 family transporter protein [Patescibacteria group bacterium]|nr:ABC-2 family transporter protein [Patescibacteria group bacterium]